MTRESDKSAEATENGPTLLAKAMVKIYDLTLLKAAPFTPEERAMVTKALDDLKFDVLPGLAAGGLKGINTPNDADELISRKALELLSSRVSSVQQLGKIMARCVYLRTCLEPSDLARAVESVRLRLENTRNP